MGVGRNICIEAYYELFIGCEFIDHEMNFKWSPPIGHHTLMEVLCEVFDCGMFVDHGISLELSAATDKNI